MAKRTRKRKYRNCGELFHPDHRNMKKQRYCSKADCRAASKKVSNGQRGRCCFIRAKGTLLFYKGKGDVVVLLT